MEKNNKKVKSIKESNINKKDEIIQPIIDLNVFDPYRDYRCEECDSNGNIK